jgi:hypothetical protein
LERYEKKGEKSASKIVPSSNYHKEDEAFKSTKTHYPSNPKPSFNPKREVRKESPKSREKSLCACFIAVSVTWMSFASVARELRRCALTMPKTHIVISSLIFHLFSYYRASPHTSSRALSHFSHRPNYRSYGFGS